MKRFFFLCACCMTFASNTQAQQVPDQCGTSYADQQLTLPRLRANIAAVENGQTVQERTIRYVPIHFHLVGDASGNGKHRVSKVLDQMCDLNAVYDSFEIRYYLRPHPSYGLFDMSINNDNVYSNQTNAQLMNQRRHNNALNVFVVDVAGSGNTGPGTVLAYYSPSRDWVVSRKQEINGNEDQTLPHEIGHFFSLNHTFYGYESNPFDGYVGPLYASDPTWPIAPVISPDGTPTERVNGTNCSTAGDEICDTPPDYNFGLSPLQPENCIYAGGAAGVIAKDPLSTEVNPQENNFMSYFGNCNSYVFSTMQKEVMSTDLNSASRNYLDNTFVPIATSIATPTDLLVNPANDVTTQYYDEVLLEWQPVTGATYYLIEVDRVNSYASNFYQFFVSTSTSQMLTTLEANKTYYWRVRPFNEYATCASSQQRKFKTPLISGVDDITGLSAWQVSPNPLTNSDVARLAVAAKSDFDANVAVFDAVGARILALNNIHFNAGDTTIDLPVGNLHNGVYYVRLESETGSAVRRLAILR